MRKYELILVHMCECELILVLMREWDTSLNARVWMWDDISAHAHTWIWVNISAHVPVWIWVNISAHLGDWDTLMACLRYSTTPVLPLYSAIRKGVHPFLTVRHSRSHAQIRGENIEYAGYGLRVVMRIANNNDHGYQTHPLKPTHTLHPRAPHTHTSIYCTHIRTPRHISHSTHIQHIHTHAHVGASNNWHILTRTRQRPMHHMPASKPCLACSDHPCTLSQSISRHRGGQSKRQPRGESPRPRWVTIWQSEDNIWSHTHIMDMLSFGVTG